MYKTFLLQGYVASVDNIRFLMTHPIIHHLCIYIIISFLSSSIHPVIQSTNHQTIHPSQSIYAQIYAYKYITISYHSQEKGTEKKTYLLKKLPIRIFRFSFFMLFIPISISLLIKRMKIETLWLVRLRVKRKHSLSFTIMFSYPDALLCLATLTSNIY